MPTRQPIGTPDVLDKTQHGGKNIQYNLFGDANSPQNAPYGFNTGYFVATLPATAILVTKSVVPSYPIRIVDVKVESDGTQGAGKVVLVRKISGGVTTTLFSVSLTTNSNAIDRPLGAAVNWATRALALGDQLIIESSDLTVPVYVFIQTANL